MIQAADEIIAGKFRDQFITDVIQGGAGTSMNMNMNEVIANRANEILGGELGKYDRCHPNDHVNYGQSTNDVVPTAGKLTVQLLIKDLLTDLQYLYDTLQAKGNEFDHVIKWVEHTYKMLYLLDLGKSLELSLNLYLEI